MGRAMEPMFQQLGLALLLGLLVGLQREHAAAGMAGMRTFPLITRPGDRRGPAGRPSSAAGSWPPGCWASSP